MGGGKKRNKKKVGKVIARFFKVDTDKQLQPFQSAAQQAVEIRCCKEDVKNEDKDERKWNVTVHDCEIPFENQECGTYGMTEQNQGLI